MKRDVAVNRWVKSRAKLRAKKQNRDFQDSSWSDKIYQNYRRNHRGKAERILDKKTLCLQARAIYIYIYVKFRQPVKEKILSKGTLQEAKYCHYIFSISLNLKKEERKEKKWKKDIYVYVLSTDNIADTLNMCVRVYIKKNLLYFNVPTCWNLFIVLSACQVVNCMLSFQLRSPHIFLA